MPLIYPGKQFDAKYSLILILGFFFPDFRSSTGVPVHRPYLWYVAFSVKLIAFIDWRFCQVDSCWNPFLLMSTYIFLTLLSHWIFFGSVHLMLLCFFNSMYHIGTVISEHVLIFVNSIMWFMWMNFWHWIKC